MGFLTIWKETAGGNWLTLEEPVWPWLHPSASLAACQGTPHERKASCRRDECLVNACGTLHNPPWRTKPLQGACHYIMELLQRKPASFPKCSRKIGSHQAPSTWLGCPWSWVGQGLTWINVNDWSHMCIKVLQWSAWYLWDPPKWQKSG